MKFDDYLLRAIEQFTQSIARIVKALRGDEEEVAESELAGAYDALLGDNRLFLDMVDPNTLANLLGSAEKVRVLAQLSALEAQLSDRRGDPSRAAALHERAQVLLQIVRRDDPQAGDETLLNNLF